MHFNKGFSLLEILVAFSIMAISLGILLKIFSSGVNTAIIAEEYTIATQIAESLMAKIGTETILEESSDSGTLEEKYHWRVNLEAFHNPATADEEGDVLQLMAVKVIVQWGEDDNYNNRTVELNTVKIVPVDHDNES